LLKQSHGVAGLQTFTSAKREPVDAEPFDSEFECRSGKSQPLGCTVGTGNAAVWLSFSTESGYHWNADAARRANVGLRFWVYVTTIPLTLLTLVSLVVAWWAPSDVRNWWFAAAIAVLVDRVMTFGYFIPTMLTLMNNSTISASEAVAKATQWINLGYVRHIATLAGWLASLRAFSLLSKLG
jgi:hypothetical protein